ncbi:hypothetical protein NC652_030151 [Populus alba x Populus x berolinensis]|nr:hypothetical protein NC652_030151 [Populus alba x Populus x berolinensis]
MASSAVTKQSYCNSLLILISLAFFCVAKTCFVEKFEPQMGSGDDFIKLHVRLQLTRYPDLCCKTLSGYDNTIQDNPTQLANASLSETLKCAESTLNMFSLKEIANNQFDLKKRSDIHFILSFNSISRRTRQLPPSRLRPNFSRSNAQPTSIPRVMELFAIKSGDELPFSDTSL